MLVMAALTVLGTAAMAFYIRFLVALCKEGKRQTGLTNPQTSLKRGNPTEEQRALREHGPGVPSLSETVVRLRKEFDVDPGSIR